MTPDLSRIGTSHLMQLFDSDESLAEAVAQFFADGFGLGESMLAVMNGRRWYAVAMRLAAREIPLEEALQSGQLVVRDAEETLTAFMRRDRPDSALFDASVGELVSGLVARGGPLRIYGEMVNVLAEQGQYSAALELEMLWNELGARQKFTLFCGYAAGHFGDPRDAAALRLICASHGEVRSSSDDVLGTFLLRTHWTG